jgi:hypothetical protein
MKKKVSGSLGRLKFDQEEQQEMARREVGGAQEEYKRNRAIRAEAERRARTEAVGRK